MTSHTLCRLLAGPADAAVSLALSSDEWRLLADTARREGVAPLLYYSLNKAGWPEDVPPEVQSDLRRAYYATTAANLLIFRELSRVLVALATARPKGQGDKETSRKSLHLPCPPSPPLPVILLKGPALATTLYPTLGLRPMGDIDLLVPEDRLAEAVARLKALGYVEPYPEMAAGLNVLAGHHVHLQGGQDIPLVVEVHWTLIGGEHDWRSPSLPWFWEQTEEWKGEDGKWKREVQLPSSNLHSPSSILQVPTSNPKSEIPSPKSQIRILTPTAHLLYLSAHLMLQHGEARSILRWFYDIHLLVEREGQRVQWGEVITRAREFRWAPAVHAALVGCRDRFGTRLPAGVLEGLAEASDRQASRLVARRANRLQTRATGVLDVVSALSPRARLRLLLAIAVPSPAYMRWRYNPRPAWLWPLCYPYRWFDILRESLSTLWQIANSSLVLRLSKGWLTAWCRSREERTGIHR